MMRDEFAAEVHRLGRGSAREFGRQTKLTFSGLAAEWLARMTGLVTAGALAPRTLDHYEGAVRLHLLPAFGGLRLHSIGHVQLLDWLAAQRALGASTWSISGRWSVLNMVLRFALRIGAISRHPADALTAMERPKVGQRRPRVLTDIEIHALLNAADSPTRELAALTVFAGLRISEALGLIWADVDQASGLLRVRHQLSRQGVRTELKTATASRDVVLMTALAEVLGQLRSTKISTGDQGPVFAAASGRPISARAITSDFASAARAAGLVGVVPHTGRHTFASILIAQGRDVMFVADQLGHANAAMTLRLYGHLFRAAKQRELARHDLDNDYGGLLAAAERTHADSP
jgi:integrase